MKIGLHMGYWWGTDIGSDIKAIIAYTAQTGVDYLEINPRYFLHGRPPRNARICEAMPRIWAWGF